MTVSMNGGAHDRDKYNNKDKIFGSSVVWTITVQRQVMDGPCLESML